MSTRCTFSASESSTSGVSPLLTMQGSARFVDPHTVCITDSANDDHVFGAAAVVIAVGTSPYRPPHIPFDDTHVLDSDAIKLHVRVHSDDPQALAQLLAGGVHPVPGTRAQVGLDGDRFLFEDSDGRQAIHLAPLGTPKSDLRTSGDLVEGDVTIPAPDGLD